MNNIDGEFERAGRRGSLRLFLSLVMIALLAGVSATLVGISYVRARSAIIENVDSRMRGFADRLAGRLEVLSGNASAMVGMVASVPNSLLSDIYDRTDDKIAVLRQVIAHSSDIESAYAGYPDGGFFDIVNLRNKAWRGSLGAPADAQMAVIMSRPGAFGELNSRIMFIDAQGRTMPDVSRMASSFDARSRPWYSAALGRQGPVATGPYEMSRTGALGVTISQAHVGNPKIVIGADVLLQRLGDFFVQTRISPGSVAFLLDANDRLVLHSNQAINRRVIAARSERDSEQSYLSDPLLAAIRAKPPLPGTANLVTAGQRTYVVMVAPIRSTVLFSGDRLITAAPLGELMVSANRGLAQGLGAALLVVALAIICALVIAHLITKSLHQLTEGAYRFQTLDFTTPILVPSRIREISLLGTAMNSARSAILNFTLYLPREFVRKGLESGDFSGRSARRRQVTAVFSDIYDFTTISEQHSPEEVVAMLSEYFDLLNVSVEAHGGTIIQFLGDSIFAMWNAPVADAHHAEHACRAALDMNRQVEQFNARQRRRNLPEFQTRWGIHTGAAVVGSFGAAERLQYTAMGDSINVASRLEGMNKDYGTSILASAAVVEQCEDKSLFRPLGTAQAKGRAGVLDVFEVTETPET